MSLFRGATFYITAHHLSDLPPPLGAEIAFAGRSNVGKSSLINALVGHEGLARTSNTPGRTQELLFFAADGTAVIASSPQEFQARIKSELARWAKVVKDTGARVD